MKIVSAKTSRLSESLRSGISLSGYSVLLNIFLSFVKIFTGISGFSYALIADGIESLLDVLSSLIVWFGLKYSLKPPDKTHPYGHGKAETIAGMVTAIFLIVAATLIAVLSVIEILTPHRTPEIYTLAVLGFIIAIKEFLYQKLSSKSRELESKALLNDAWHHRSDALTSLAAFAGISVAIIGGPGYETADDWAALAACLIIYYNGYRLSRSTLSEMMDISASDNFIRKVRNIVQGVNGIIDVEKCLIRKSGLKYFIDIHITVSGKISVKEGHTLAHKAKDELMCSQLPISDVAIHVEPDEFDN